MKIKGQIVKFKNEINKMAELVNYNFFLRTENGEAFTCCGKAQPVLFQGEYIVLEGENVVAKSGARYFKFTNVRQDMDTDISKTQALKRICGDMTYKKLYASIMSKCSRHFKDQAEKTSHINQRILQILDDNDTLAFRKYEVSEVASNRALKKYNDEFLYFKFCQEFNRKYNFDMKECHKVFNNKKFQKNRDVNIARIQENPYELLLLSDIPFEIIDEAYKNDKNEEHHFDDAKRIVGGILAAEKLEFNRGNNYTEKEDLLVKANSVLISSASFDYRPIDKADILSAYRTLVNHDVLKEDGNDVYLKEIFDYESFIRQFVLAMRDNCNDYDYTNEITGYELKMGYKLGRDQKLAVQNCMSHQLSIMTGGAGTGKTSTVCCVIRLLLDQGFDPTDFALAAPTGKAAQRMMESIRKNLGIELPATTIHVLLEPDPKSFGGSEEDECFIHNQENKLGQKIIIIDETSMVDYRIAYHLCSAISPDTKVIFLGDCEQLPPVKNGFFLRDLIESKVAHVELKETFRQAGDSSILKIAIAVRNEKLTWYDLQRANDFNFIDLRGDESRFDYNLGIIVRAFKAGVIKSSINDTIVLSPITTRKKDRRTFNTKTINLAIQKEILPDVPGEISFEKNDEIFKVGSKIIITKNNNAKGIVNGDMGFITEIDLETQQVTIELTAQDDREVILESDELKHIQLAYCVTVHKSQGSEWKNVIYCCFAETCMNKKNLVYTAVTRAKKSLLVVGDRKTFLNSIYNKPELHRSKILN